MRFSVAETIIARALSVPDRVAIEVLDGSPPVLYSEIWRRIVSISTIVDKTPEGRHGQCVGVLLPNGVNSTLAYAACQHAGVIGVVVKGRLADREMIDIIKDSDSKLVISEGKLYETAKRVCDQLGIEAINLDDMVIPENIDRPVLGEVDMGDKPCMVVYSSGTTGLPKGVVYTNDALTMNNSRWSWELGLTAEHVVLIAGPLFHSSFINLVLSALCIGARVRILPSFSAQSALDVGVQ